MVLLSSRTSQLTAAMLQLENSGRRQAGLGVAAGGERRRRAGWAWPDLGTSRATKRRNNIALSVSPGLPAVI